SANLGPYWNTNFTVGSGLIPTLFATSGILGILAIILFVGILLISGLKGIFNEKQDAISKLTLFLLFAGNLYLWIFAFLYTVPITLLGLTFIISGLLVAQLSSVGVTSHIKIYLTDNPRANFISVFSIVVMVLVGVAGGYFTIQKYW